MIRIQIPKAKISSAYRDTTPLINLYFTLTHFVLQLTRIYVQKHRKRQRKRATFIIMESSVQPSHSFISSDRNSLTAFLSKQLPLIFVCGQGLINPKQKLATLLPPDSTSICDGATIKTSFYELIDYLQEKLKINPPKKTLKLTQHLDYIYTSSAREKKHIFLVIHNSHLISLPCSFAAIAHLTLLQKDNPTFSAAILTNKKIIQQTAQLGLSRFPQLKLIDLEKNSIFKDSFLKRLKSKKQLIIGYLNRKQLQQH